MHIILVRNIIFKSIFVFESINILFNFYHLFGLFFNILNKSFLLCLIILFTFTFGYFCTKVSDKRKVILAKSFPVQNKTNL